MGCIDLESASARSGGAGDAGYARAFATRRSRFPGRPVGPLLSRPWAVVRRRLRCAGIAAHRRPSTHYHRRVYRGTGLQGHSARSAARGDAGRITSAARRRPRGLQSRPAGRAQAPPECVGDAWRCAGIAYAPLPTRPTPGRDPTAHPSVIVGTGSPMAAGILLAGRRPRPSPRRVAPGKPWGGHRVRLSDTGGGP